MSNSVFEDDDDDDSDSIDGLSTVYTKPLTHAQESAETFAQLPPGSDDFWDL